MSIYSVIQFIYEISIIYSTEKNTLGDREIAQAIPG